MENMKWIDVNDKHFVDIEHFEDGSYNCKVNENLPKGPFLVGRFLYNNITKEYTDFDYCLLVLGDYGIQEFTEDGTVIFCRWDLLQIEYWCEVVQPKKQ